MVPRITSRGASFKGAGAYFLHDLGQAESAERVAFTHTVNMLTDDPDKALKVMAWTAEHAHELKEISGQKLTGRKAQNPVYTYCLAWAPDQDPDREEMIAFGLQSLQALGVDHHEALFVAHNDTPHKHLHVILNRVDPETGLMAKMSHDQNRLSRLAQAYEEDTGRIYCAQRVENNRRRDLGESPVKAEAVERLAESPDYQARRAARIEAQRQAAALAAQRLQGEQARQTAARDLRAAFDQAASTDDRQYRAKELEPTPADEDRKARAAWADERATQQAKAKAEQEQARFERKDAARRAALNERRAAAWDSYETSRWQVFNDRETDRREALHEKHAAAEARFGVRLDRKFAPSEQVLELRREAAAAMLQAGGMRGVLDRLTGKRLQAVEALETVQAAAERLALQKAQERDGFAAKLAQQRADAAHRQEQERQREAERLQALKARQDAAFEKKEQERAQRLAQQRERAAAEGGAARTAWAQAARAQVQAVANERAQRATSAEAAQQREWGLGLGLGR